MRARHAFQVAVFAVLLSAPAAGNVYTVTNTADSGAGSLRWAIGEANGHAGADQVAFNIPGAGVRVIQVASVLPPLAMQTSILGSTQPGYAGTPLVRIDGGDLAENYVGLDLTGGSQTVQGLEIVRFNGPGVRVWADYVTLRGNRFGTDGAADLGNAAGIYCNGAAGLVVGGTGNDGNLISGNGGDGIVLVEGCGGALVIGNRIGTNAAGTAALPNGGSGVAVYTSGNQIGGSGAGEGNVISGNAYNGVVLAGGTANNLVRGNRIGTNAAGNAALGNGSNGIVLDGTGQTVGGLTPGGGNLISGNAYGLEVAPTGTGNSIVGNRIGTDIAGSVAIGNLYDGLRIYGDGNFLGGGNPAARNVVSGNGNNGVVLGDDAAGNVVAGNYIGTSATATSALPNSGSGVWIGGDDNQIGGIAAGEGNVISGNGQAGIVIDDVASLSRVEGNRIGTNGTGAAALPNDGGGIQLYGPDSRIGGAAPGAGNLISGNAYNGIVIHGDAVDGSEIRGNRIGTNAAGSAAVGNQGYGIRALSGLGLVVADNLISGNGRAFSLEYDAAGYTVQGNVIGLDAAMSAKLPNASNGLEISSPGHTIGGAAAGEGNVIAGNDYFGVWITGAGASGNVLEGNWIGTNPSGAAGLGNDSCGITIDQASGNRIGGLDPGSGNVIAHNGYLGVYVWSGAGNAILGNSIHDNELLGIELDPQGPFANDPGDGDAGPNRGQNFPVVTSALAAGGSLEIAGVLDSRPSTEYRIELFSNPTFDPTGVGEGESFLGAVTVTTDEFGHAPFAATVAAAGGDAFVTATATSPTHDTSEFSPAIAVGAPQPGQLQIWRDVLLSYEGVPGLEVTIVRSHGVQGAISVDVATLEGTADSPDDFGALATTLDFAPGETMRTVFVPIVEDGVDEENETWRLRLSNPAGGAALGPNDDVLAWLFDASVDWPIYAVNDAVVVEGDAGQRTLTFTVTLSATDEDLAIRWWTSNGTALAGEDYVEADGELLFHPGDGSKTISIAVSGDAEVEPDEELYVHLYGLGQSIVWDGLGLGRILDDDGGSADLLFADAFESGDAEAWSSIAGWP